MICDKKFNENRINKDNEDKKTKTKTKKSIVVANFDIKKAKEFLRMNENKKKIDLHGFTLVQSMYIIEKMLISLRKKKNEENLKEITLNIITGVGNHSLGHKPVLHPNLTIWLKSMHKYTVDEKSVQGNIFIKIY